MKYLVLTLTLGFFICFAKAQSLILPKDENEKFIYYEVVEKQSSLNMLQSRTKTFFDPKNKKIKLKMVDGDTVFSANGKFVITKTKAVPSHPSGEVLYDLTIELKNNKYRFWLTDFKFIPYQRDRYSNFVPSTTVGRPLEQNAGMLNAGQWKEIQQQTANYSKMLAADLKGQLAGADANVKPEEKKILKKDW